MSVLKKLVTLMRGSVREIGDSVVDANATRIYEQEIIDAKNAVAQARSDLTTVMAKEMQTAREIERLKAESQRFELLALEALNKSQEGLAEEVANRVAELERELEEQTQAHASYAVKVAKLKELIKGAEGKIREHERQIVMAKTTESVYRATRSIADSVDGTGSKLLSAKESLERIRQRTYGRCEECDHAIPGLRLRIRPQARFCIGCQGMREQPPLTALRKRARAASALRRTSA